MKTRFTFLLAFLFAIVQGAWAQTDKETPLTLDVRTAGMIVINYPKSGMQYSVNGGAKTAVSTEYTQFVINVAIGDKVEFYGTGTSLTSYAYSQIKGTAEYYVYGNIMSLVDEYNFATATTLTSERAFATLFQENTKVFNHPTRKLVLPATTLTNNCYEQMFFRCTNLTEAPVLPATTLVTDCYKNMFAGCTNLNSVTCYATSSASGATSYWLNDVAATGTFVKANEMESWSTGKDGIPSGWTVKNVFTYVTTEAELKAAIADGANIIKLMEDITLAQGVEIPENTTVTLDLNGHTLQRNEEGYHWYYMVIHVLENATLTINDSSGDNSGKITGGHAYGGAGIYCEGGSSLTFNGGSVIGNSSTNDPSNGAGFGGGILINSGAEATINGGVIKSNSGPQGGGIYNQGTLTISSNALISNNTGYDGGGIFNTGLLNINGGTIQYNQAATLGGGGITNYGTINMTGGSIMFNASTTAGGGIWNGNYLNMQGNPVVSFNTSGTNGNDNVFFNGSTAINVTEAFTEGAKIGVRPANTSNAFTSGYNTYNAGTTPDNFFSSDVAFHKMSLNDSGEAILTEINDNWIDYKAESFSSQSDNTITIKNEAEFALLAYNVNNGNDYYGTTFVLSTDLNMVTHYWTPIGTPDNPFRGNFDGNNHTIDGINVNTTNDYAGLFGCVKGQEWNRYTPTPQWGPGSEYVKNFVMTNATITGGDYTGAVVGWLPWRVTVENVFCQANVTGGNHVGGLIGREEGKKVTDWYFDTPTVRKCLLTGGTIVATGSDKAALVGSITNWTNYENNFYLDPASAVGNSRDVRAYPVYKSLSNGVTITYNNGSTGVVYNDVYYYPAGTCNFSVAYPLTPTESISVAVNGTQLGNQVGNYQFAVSAETASYTIYVTVSPSGITGDGSVDNPYIINTATQWDICTAAVGAGDSYNGVYFKLGSPITVTTMMGTNDNQPFSGTFDGDGKTLTLDYGKSNDYLNYECAPFYRLNNATIKNLVIAGSIYSSAQHNGGLAVKATGGNNHIENCVSNVSIHSNISGDCTNGGFIGLLNVHETRVYFNGCAFTGKLLGENATNWGGFVGWRLYRTDGQENWSTSYVTFTNCLFAPTTINIKTEGGNSRTFCRSYNNYTDGASYNNCYYNEALQNVDGGKQMHSITAGEGVTLANAGTITTYSLSGITGYGVGIKYNDVLYAGNGDEVSLTLSGSATGHYICGETALIGHANPYTLRMPNADAVVSAWNVTVPATIASVSDWNTFCTAVNAGYEYQGETVTMTANVGTFEDPVNTKAGDDNHPFMGTFDGGGFTLTIGFGSSSSYSDQKCAPFHRLDNATVKDLVVAGSIYSSAQHNAGIAVTSTDHNTHIENCVSNVSINSNIDGDCSNGGFIGILNTSGGAHVYFNGCAFTGELLGANTTNWGGFVGWRSWTDNNYCYINFTDCIFFPTTINIATPSGSNSLTFCRAPSGPGASHHNCYYSQVLQVDDGGNQMYSITAGEGVTALENTADAVGTYTVSHIFNYDAGIKFNDVLYAKSGDNVSLNITGTSTNYICGETALLGRENPYTLRMPNGNAVISEWNVTPPETIASVSDWNTFCTAVNAGYNYQGETVTMIADVGTDADPAVTKAGTDDNHPFRGTFDGGGHTLTIGYGSSSSYSDQKCAPFYRLNNATIRNLVVAGHIYSSTQHNGGIATSVYGNNNHIENCVSNVSIHSNRSGSGDAGDCTNGGFIGVLNTNGTYIYFEGCAFTGQLLGENATNWGGFIGWRFYESNNYNDAYFTDCLFAPTTVSIKLEGGNSRPFCRSYNSTGASYANSYYTEALQGAFGGKQAYIFTNAPANIGEAGTNYGFVTAYANGLKFAGSHYMAPEAVSLANDAANSTDLSGKNGYFATVTLTDRTLYRDGDWNTLCLPFAVNITTAPLAGDDVVAMTLDNTTSGLSGTTLTLNFNAVSTTDEQAGVIPAGTPFIIKWASKESAENLVNPVFNGVTINKATNNVTSTDGKVTFIGTYDAQTFTSEDKSILFLGAENTLYWPLAGASIGAQRAYFQLNGIIAGSNAEVREFKLNFGDDDSNTTRIDVVDNGQWRMDNSNDAWYTLDGRKLSGEPTKKGMYIVNGKKVVIK